MRQNPDNKEKKLAKKNTAVSQNQGLSMENESGQIIASLEDQLKLQKLISKISAKFVNLAASKVDSEINNGLKIILEYMNLDRCTLAELSKNKKDLHVTHSYYKPGFEPITNSNVMDSFPWLGENLIQGNIVAITKPLDFPSIANEEREYCQQKGLKSILAIPVSVGGSLMCTLAFITFRNYQNWPKYAIEQLTLIVEVFANAIFRKRSDEQQRLHVENLAKQVQFEQLISSLSARFINVQTKQVGQKIEESLRQLAEYIGVDRSTFFRISKEQNKLIPVHTYVVEGVETLGEIPFMSWFPWAAKKIIAGDLVVFSSDEQLSPAAEQDRIQLGKKLDLKSVIAVPLHIDGEVKYALSVGNVKRHTNIQKEIAPRLQLVGEIFINALLRCKNMEQIQKKDIKLKAAYKKISKISEKLALENRYFQNEINASFQSSQMIGISGGLKYIFYRISQVAPSDTTVLLEGETGTGKELIARALHELSKRNKRPLIKLDCTTLHDSMIVSELFGHEKGAFTGAINEHIGRLEVADGSTLFLDEIGEIPLALQAKLLRVIEYGEFERLGSTKTRKVNIRIIAATNRNLSEAVEQGKFRQDLFYRLSVFPLSVPPLRERKEDIPLLANFFIQHFNKQMGKQVEEIPKNILKALQGYSWQGNVRELKNVIERAMITTEGSVLKLTDIMADQSHETVSPTNGESLKEVERKHILKVLQETYWRIEGKAGAALKLGLHPDTLRSRMKKLGIKRPSLDK